MKYRNLKLSYEIDNLIFSVINIGEEALPNPIPRHSHSGNSYELHFISDGHGTLIAEGMKYELCPGMFYITGPYVNHEQISAAGDTMQEFGIYMKVSHEKKAIPNSIANTFLKTLFWIGTPDNKVYELIKKIDNELNSRPLGYELMLPALLRELTIELSRLFTNKQTVQNPIPTIIPEDLTELVIEEAFLYEYKDLTLEDLSRRINLGTRQTERLLIKHYQKSFSQMKTDARMSAAALMLTETNDSIASISEALGYSSPEHFSLAFRKYYRKTPSGYRS